MTEKEIIQTLRICSRRTDVQTCAECPLFDSEDCMGDMTIGAADLIERLTAENAALREKVPQWISVEDRLPIDRLSKYLVAFRDAGGSIVDMARYFPSDGWTCDNWEVPQNLITHWMPLPGAPEEE
nr:MAG TPA: Protein of unknown function (DUF551) [Caudoviricetes sp.]